MINLLKCRIRGSYSQHYRDFGLGSLLGNPFPTFGRFRYRSGPCASHYQKSASVCRLCAFIQYDLGVKYQKGQLKTSLSDKNELLRIQAVFIANFMVEHQNIHLHVSDSAFIGSGQDPQALEENITHKSLNITAA